MATVINNMSDTDKQALVNNGCTILSNIIIDNGDETTTVLDETNYIINWDLEDFRYVPNVGIIGQFVEKQLTGKLKNVNDDFSIVNKTFELQVGIKIDDNEPSWYTLGHYIVSEQADDNVADTMTFKAKDYTKYFEKPYEDRVEYPTTARILAEDVCGQCGVSLSSDTFINEDFIIENNQFVNNESCREVMKAISMLAYSWCRISFDDTVHLDFNSHSPVSSINTIDNDHYYDLITDGSTYGAINKVVIGLKDVEGENVAITQEGTDGDNVLSLWDNPLTYTQELRQSVIDSASILYGLSYTAVESTTIGYLWLIGNETIRFVNMENGTFDTYPLDRTISYSGHVKTKIKSPVESLTNAQYTYESKVLNSVRNTQIKVDKAEGTITSIANRTEALNDTVVELGTQVTQGLEGIDINISNLQTTIDENKNELQSQLDNVNNTLEDGVTKLKNTLVNIDIDGIHVSTNLSKISTIMTNDTFAVQDNGGTYLAYFGYDETEGKSKAQMDNLTITNYFTAGVHRVEAYKDESTYENRTGWFYVGGDY